MTGQRQPAEVELRPFLKSIPPRIADISDLHKDLLPSSPVVKLGRRFTENFYYRVLPAEGYISGAVAYVDSRPAGFVSFTDDSTRFMRRAAGSHIVSLAGLVMWSVLANPLRIAALWDAAGIMRGRKYSFGAGRLGEILSIGVLPEYRSKEFRERTGVHLARRLLDLALLQLRSAGVSAVTAVVDADNLRSQSLFESAGFRVQSDKPQGWSVPSVELVLDLDRSDIAGTSDVAEAAQPLASQVDGRAVRLDVSVVIPCHNEEKSIQFLALNLASLARSGANRFNFDYIFVDDGSSDGTWEALQRKFGDWPACQFVRHPANLGVAAAVLTGLERARAEVVCAIDADCSYDPRELLVMVPQLTDGVDMVTASPYHPRGRVTGVPAWRLALSRVASMLHRWAAGGRLYTYSSCFRVYRRSSFAGMRLEHAGFSGITEMLHSTVLRGGRVVEHPASLEVRATGSSKLSVARVAVAHLLQLAQILRLRVLGKTDQ
jgi:dolichol-phosphate mannosyltransferase